MIQSTSKIEKLNELCSFALSEINAKNIEGLNLNGFTLQSILSYWTQIISGVNHKLAIEVGNNFQVKMIMFTIWERPWLSNAESMILNEFYILDETTSNLTWLNFNFNYYCSF